MTGSSERASAASAPVALVGGFVADGSGGEPVRADVLLSGGVVEAVVRVADGSAAAGAGSAGSPYAAYRSVDCGGRIVAPGFVDVHCHSDLSLLAYPDNASRVTQGVTTEVVGNCGMSPAPTGGDRSGLAAVIGPIDVVPDLPWEWTDAAGWLEALESAAIATNVVAQVGHGTARFVVAGAQARPLEDESSRALERELETALDAGCAGVSLGLMYAPGEGADHAELVRVGRVAARRGVVLSAHMRDYSGDRLASSVEEVLRVAEETGARLQISHLRRTGRGGDFAAVLERIELARASVDVAADAYPYVSGHTNLIQLLPTEVRGLGPIAITELCRTGPGLVAGLLRDSGYAPNQLVIMKAPQTPEFSGLGVEQFDGDPWRRLVELLIANECNVDAAVESGRWDDVDLALATPWVSVASDGTALSAAHRASVPHPRSWGSFPAGYRRMRGAGIGIGEAVRRMTDAPASRVGRTARVLPGADADLVVIDDETFDARADYASPAQPSAGIDHVFVRGVPVLTHGTPTGRRPGRLMRGGGRV